MSTHTVSVHYEDDAGEHDLLVQVTGYGRDQPAIEGDLNEVPEDELTNVEQQARDRYWELERAEYVRSGAAEREGD